MSNRMWHVIAMRQEDRVWTERIYLRTGRRDELEPHDVTKIEKAPIKVSLVIQRCETAEMAKKWMAAYFGTMKHSILWVSEIKTPEDVVHAWRSGATLL